MRLSILSRILLSSLAMLLYMASAVRADFYITGKLAGGFSGPGQALNPGAEVEINYGNGKAPSLDYYPGEVNWTMKGTNASGMPPVGSSFQTFCIELTQDVSPGNTYTYNLVDLADAPSPGSSQTGGSGGMGQEKANAIAALWAADYGSIANAPSIHQADINAAALQLAIWKIEYDWGSSNEAFNSGNFRASAIRGEPNSAAAITQAESWLNSLGWNDNNLPNETSLIALSSNTAQDQVMPLPLTPAHLPAPAPAPPSFCLAGIGGLVLIVYGYWRRRPAMGIAPS